MTIKAFITYTTMSISALAWGVIIIAMAGPLLQLYTHGGHRHSLIIYYIILPFIMAIASVAGTIWLRRANKTTSALLVPIASLFVLCVALFGGNVMRALSIDHPSPKMQSMQTAIAEYRRTYRQADLDITSVVEKFISNGEDANVVLDELKQAGFKIYQNTNKSGVWTNGASKRVYYGPVSVMTGFGYEERIIFNIQSGKIADLKAYMFFKSL